MRVDGLLFFGGFGILAAEFPSGKASSPAPTGGVSFVRGLVERAPPPYRMLTCAVARAAKHQDPAVW